MIQKSSGKELTKVGKTSKNEIEIRAPERSYSSRHEEIVKMDKGKKNEEEANTYRLDHRGKDEQRTNAMGKQCLEEFKNAQKGI